jgi:hypothetical protein
MKTIIKILSLCLISISCNSSKNIEYKVHTVPNGSLVEFTSSKIMIFDSAYSQKYDYRKFFNPSISDILIINKKLQKNYYKYKKRNDLYNLINLRDEVSTKTYKENLILARYTQKNFNQLDKQYVGLIDSLGRKRILVNIVYNDEKKTVTDLENYFVGLYDVRINAENLSFVDYYE